MKTENTLNNREIYEHIQDFYTVLQIRKPTKTYKYYTQVQKP